VAAADDDRAATPEITQESPMPIHLPARPLKLALTIALWTAALAALLTLPARTLAQGHKAACSTHSATHAKARTHTSTCPSHKGKHARHGSGRRRTAKPHAKSKPAPRLQTPALCEDESIPVRAANGGFSCDDGSEPGCEDGSNPVRSGHALECQISPPGSEPACAEEGAASSCQGGSDEPVCEDGSAPATAGDGSSSCDDGSEPTHSAGLGLVCKNAAAVDSED
jgi:hypothetical protein